LLLRRSRQSVTVTHRVTALRGLKPYTRGE
jgi:hypothetical protein